MRQNNWFKYLEQIAIILEVFMKTIGGSKNNIYWGIIYN